MMRQLALGLSPPPRPTLDNFVPGANAELVARLRELVSGNSVESIVYLWGEPGSGKSHLLRACARDGLHVADDVQALDEEPQIALFNRINEARQSGGALSQNLNVRPTRTENSDLCAMNRLSRMAACPNATKSSSPGANSQR